jgi:hypothetical protein
MIGKSVPAAMWAVVLTILLSLCPAAAGSGQEAPFAPGERLEYEIKWEFVPAGRAEMQVHHGRLQGRKVYRFVLKAETNSFVSLFYKLREKIESYTDRDLKRSYLYKERNKGSEEKKILVSFDWEDMVAQYSDFGKKREPVAITPGTYDPLASFYAFRTRELREGASIEFPVTDGKKHFRGKAAVAAKERIEVNGRELETFKVKPEVNYFGGVFEESEDPSLTIWITADERKIPVKVDVKVAIGSVVAELESITRPLGRDMAAK